MKNSKGLIIGTVLGLAVCGLAIAQAHRSGAFDHNLGQYHGNAASAAQHLAEVFPQIAAFDANNDGKLDEAEKEALGKAIADGTVQLPAHTPPHGVKPTTEMIRNHIAEMYARVAPYDANHDGQLDQREQATLKSAIEKGEWVPHGLPPHQGGVKN